MFGPGDVFPYAPERKYTPCDAGKEQLFALRDFLGFERNVIVQATCHGADNRALVDALRAAERPGPRRGDGPARRVTDAELADLHEAGVRGVRFNFVKRLVDPKPDDYYRGIVDADRPSSAGTSSSTSRPRTWPSAGTFSPRLPTTVVVDHMGRPDVTQAGRRPGVRAVPAAACASTRTSGPR